MDSRHKKEIQAKLTKELNLNKDYMVDITLLKRLNGMQTTKRTIYNKTAEWIHSKITDLGSRESLYQWLCVCVCVGGGGGGFSASQMSNEKDKKPLII